ncbi:uncharacterized protein TNCV_1495111 [Trichonephila clavipes]|nr:uncharacterized protein TNCV_1495111 [Trichonephila clavipes]
MAEPWMTRHSLPPQNKWRGRRWLFHVADTVHSKGLGNRHPIPMCCFGKGKYEETTSRRGGKTRNTRMKKEIPAWDYSRKYRSLVGITFQDGDRFNSCQVIYSQFGLAIHQNDHQARRRFVEWAQNEIAVVPDFHKRILLSDEVHFWLNGYVNKQNCRIWSEANPQVYVETPLHPEKLTVGCALWAGGILLQKRWPQRYSQW